MLLTTLTLCAVQAPDYQGKFKDHRNLPELIEIVEEVASDAPGQLPKWLGKERPTVTVELVDAEEPFERMDWPGRLPMVFSMEGEKKGWSCVISLPIDSLIRDLSLVEPALKRQIFGVAAARAELDSGVNVMDMGKQGLANPFVDAMASHWAGSLDQEIDYALLQHLESDEALAALVSEFEAPEEGFQLTGAAEHDLTVLVFTKMVAPKNDRKLGAFFEAMLNKRPFESVLKAASGKKLDKLNAELRKFYGKFFEKRFLKKDRPRYRRLIAAYEADDWEAYGKAEDDLKKPEFLEAHLMVLSALFLGRGEQSTDDAKLLEQKTLLLVLASFRVGSVPLASSALVRAGELYQVAGDKAKAREAWESLRDEFGWQPGMRDKATKLLESLGD